jgi:pimeloyl-ACP methyl ester carboxylesterase
VLLHGVGHHWQAWRPVIDHLIASFDVIACDSPGFGRSTPLSAGAEPTVKAYAEAFAGFFSELGVARPHVAGNSMGGATAPRRAQLLPQHRPHVATHRPPRQPPDRATRAVHYRLARSGKAVHTRRDHAGSPICATAS